MSGRRYCGVIQGITNDWEFLIVDTESKIGGEVCGCNSTHVDMLTAALNAADAREKAAGFDLADKPAKETRLLS